MTSEEHPLAGLTYQDVRHELWRRGDLSYKLDGLQRSMREIIRNSQARKICVLSSRQIGKSYMSCVLASEYLLRSKRGSIARIIAPTLKQCHDIVQDNLAPLMLDAPPGMIGRRKSEYRWDFPGGSSLRLGALERAHVDGNRGGNAGLVIYEECGFVAGEDFVYGVDSVMGPQLLRSAGTEIFVSSPSEDPDHPLHTRIKPECEMLGTFFQYTVHDSPSITPAMIAEAERRCGGRDTDAFRREYLAEIIRPSTLVVVPSYDEARHVRHFTWPLECRIHVTTDFGGIRDLTVALLHGYDYESNLDLVYDEKVWQPNTPTSTIVEGLKEWDKMWRIQSRYADLPGQVQVDVQLSGYDLVMPPKSDWLASVNAMAVKFATDRILIHPRCEFLRRSLRAGIFNKNRTDFDRLPELGHCDALAALMYAIRVQDRTNPFAAATMNRDNVFYVKHPEREDAALAEAITPAVFGSQVRAFGAFRR